ncbi:cell division protein ZapE [Photobacterium ganghwense]|uniref:Cell division protein ZapE n=1 Tax=Photobacterium ganghwense TaxID=320778 RepID=A0A0J1H3N2_9GAMM|nr:cell division protein ZapE [Photobacterium ganghwense]KLV06370.1 ATPase [Photobacterium ganghwense]PSU06734.1 cell division protein ZapE [Photobacterium ganghwense]QSV14420.1 AFG1 family ATPase [Photobacterium ganghwense]
MTPLQKYQEDLKRDDFMADPAQAMAVRHLDDLYHRLLKPKPVAERTMMDRVLRRSPPPPPPEKGLYFWGGVGRGKTYLVDTFYDCLPTQRKMRVHFHRFMQRVHDELRTLEQQADPLQVVADRFKREADLICFDEFFVSDITDAMLLGTLFEALFKRGITLVATSNIPPDELYRNGLQRARFLPAIALIKANCEVVNVDSGVDYRLRTLEQAEIYHAPLDAAAEQNMLRYFEQLSVAPRFSGKNIEINHRTLPTLHEAEGVVHFNFATLCQTARSQADYMELARLYHTVLLSEVKQMGEAESDAARRFIALVDEFYERNVKLIISAEVNWENLYQGQRLAFEYKRCCSRLVEMQSHDYLARPHLA